MPTLSLSHLLLFFAVPMAYFIGMLFIIPWKEIRKFKLSGAASEERQIYEFVIPDKLEHQLPIEEIIDELTKDNQFKASSHRLGPPDLNITQLLATPQCPKIQLHYEWKLRRSVIKKHFYDCVFEGAIFTFILLPAFISIIFYLLSNYIYEYYYSNQLLFTALSLPLVLYLWVVLGGCAIELEEFIRNYEAVEKEKSRYDSVYMATEVWKASDPTAIQFINNFNQYMGKRAVIKNSYINSETGQRKKLEYAIMDRAYAIELNAQSNWTRNWQPAINLINQLNNILEHKIVFERNGNQLLTRQPTAGASFNGTYNEPANFISQWAHVIDDHKRSQEDHKRSQEIENNISELRSQLRQQHEMATWAARTGNLGAEAHYKGRIAEIESKLRQLGA